MKTFEQVISAINESNDTFEQANPAVKRMMIAQDVLDRITIKQLRPKTQHLINHILPNLNHNDSILDTLNKEKYSCNVCAKGALFLSYVGRVNNFEWSMCDLGTWHGGAEMIKLREIFSEYQLSLIETAFEGRVYVYQDREGLPLFPENSEEEKEVNAAILLYGYDNSASVPDSELANTRLVEICNNIIRNEGTYIPSQDLPENKLSTLKIKRIHPGYY
jgi:hypothetical protein